MYGVYELKDRDGETHFINLGKVLTVRGRYSDWEKGRGWVEIYFENRDHPRDYSVETQEEAQKHARAIAEAISAMNMSGRAVTYPEGKGLGIISKKYAWGKGK